MVIEKNFKGHCYINMEPSSTVKSTIANMQKATIYALQLHRLTPIVLNDQTREKFNGFFGWRERTVDNWYVYSDLDEVNRDFNQFRAEIEAESYLDLLTRLEELEKKYKKKDASKPKPPDEALAAIVTFVKENPPTGKTTHEYYDEYQNEIQPRLMVPPKDFIKAVKREGFSSVRMENLPNTKKWIVNERPRKSTF
jgi:hypothetical protein